MKQVTCILAGLVLFAVSAGGQTPTAGQKVTLATSLQRAYADVKANLTQAAQKMPEADYGFKPGSHADLRTFGAMIGHQADNQFSTCAAIKGVPNPRPPAAGGHDDSNAAQDRKAMKMTKAELVKALADSFAFCDGAISGLTDQNALQMIKRGEDETARAAVVSALVSHAHGSANVVAVYLRSKGIARPW